jgi:phage-related protein
MTALPSQFKPLIGLSEEVSYTIKEVSYGDGYKRISPNGINNKRRVISMVFPGLKETDKEDLITFIDGQIGKAWQFTPPGETAINVYTQNVSTKTIGGNRFEVSITVELLYGTF